MEFLILTWLDVVRLSYRLAQRIRESNFRPDVIVAVLRGGAIPARILSDALGVHTIATVQAYFYRGVAEHERRVEILQPLSTDVRGKRVLVVDDVADTGETLSTIVKHVTEKGAREVKVATLHIKPWTKFKPDFWVEETSCWIVYPWEYFETITELRERAGHVKDEREKAKLASVIERLEKLLQELTA